jgi:hypothetical protein
LSVSIAQKIRAYVAEGIGRGHITVNVTVTNNGPGDIFGSAGAVHFSVRRPDGNYLRDIRRTDPQVPDMTAPIPPGGSFEAEVHFDVYPVDLSHEYTLTCIFDQTGETDAATFPFRPLYLETPGQPPFAKK